MKSLCKINALLIIFSFCLNLILFNTDIWSQSPEGYPRLMQGPMLGAITDSSALVWVRTSGEFPVSVEYGIHNDFRVSTTTQPVTTNKSNDYVAVIELQKLAPATQYFYRVKIREEGVRYLKDFPGFRLKTAPIPGTKQNFRIGFGSCARFQSDREQPIWTAVAFYQPDMFFWIGDNIYGDALDPDILREEYRRQRDVRALQPVIQNIPQLAIWDDHDYGLNDHDKSHPKKDAALDVFQQYWANPAYGLADVPGVFFRQTHGSVDFFLLDVRYHRDPNANPDTLEKSMLGKQQLAWLKSELQASQALFKVLVSGSGWSIAKGPGGDSWASFLHERNDLFNFIRDNEITGVVLVSGDTHVGELNVIPWSEQGGYDLYDLVSSPLAQPVSTSWMERRPERRIRPVYFEGSNFGLIDFNFDNSPKLVFRLIDAAGRSVWKPFELSAHELVNGVKSWPDKASKKELARQENYDQGKGYYEKRND